MGGWSGGLVVGWLAGLDRNKANLSVAEAGVGLNLAIESGFLSKAQHNHNST